MKQAHFSKHTTGKGSRQSPEKTTRVQVGYYGLNCASPPPPTLMLEPSPWDLRVDCIWRWASTEVMKNNIKNNSLILKAIRVSLVQGGKVWR